MELLLSVVLDCGVLVEFPDKFVHACASMTADLTKDALLQPKHTRKIALRSSSTVDSSSSSMIVYSMIQTTVY